MRVQVSSYWLITWREWSPNQCLQMLDITHLCVWIKGEMEGREGEKYGILPAGKGGDTEISFHYDVLRIQLGARGEKYIKYGNPNN